MDYLDWKVGARYDPLNEKGYDCFGYVRCIYKEHLNVELPDNWFNWRKYGDIFEYPTKLENYDILSYKDPYLHIGIYYKGNIYHSGSKYGGVICEDFSHISRFIKRIGRLNEDRINRFIQR